MRLASDARERKQEHLVTGSVNTCHQRLQCIAWGEMSCLSSGHLTTTRLKNVTSDRAYIFHSWPFYFQLVKKKKLLCITAIKRRFSCAKVRKPQSLVRLIAFFSLASWKSWRFSHLFQLSIRTTALIYGQLKIFMFHSLVAMKGQWSTYKKKYYNCL